MVKPDMVWPFWFNANKLVLIGFANELENDSQTTFPATAMLGAPVQRYLSNRIVKSDATMPLDWPARLPIQTFEGFPMINPPPTLSLAGAPIRLIGPLLASKSVASLKLTAAVLPKPSRVMPPPIPLATIL